MSIKSFLKKIISTFTILVIACIPNYAQVKISEYGKVYSFSNKKGNIESITYSTYSVRKKKREFVKGKIKHSTTKYHFSNKNKLLTKESFSIYDGNLKLIHTMNFDDYENLKSIEWNSESTIENVHCDNVYDKSGNLIEVKSIRNNQIIQKSFYDYDTKGKISIEKIWKKNNSDTTNYTVDYKYQDDKLIEKTFKFSNRKSSETRIDFFYDENGKLIKRTQSNNENDKIQSLEITYNPKLDIKNEDVYGSNMSLIQDYHYIYDDKENWIIQIVCKNGEAIKFIERNIKYW